MDSNLKKRWVVKGIEPLKGPIRPQNLIASYRTPPIRINTHLLKPS